MARKGSADVAFIYLDAVDIIGDITEMSDTSEAVVEEDTPLGADTDTWADVGVRKFQGTLRGIYSDSGTVDDLETILEGNDPKSLAYGIEGDDAGAPYTHVDAAVGTLARNTQRDQLHRIEASFMADGKAVEGVLHSGSADYDATNDETTQQDRGANAATRPTIRAWVTDLDLGGYTDATLELLHRSTAGGVQTAVDIEADFTDTGLYTLVPTANIGRYVQVRVSFDGTGADESITFTVGIED